MEYIRFGSAGIRVSPVCLGTMTFGKEADESTAFALMDRAFDAGINFFDTANIYNKGLTENRWEMAYITAGRHHFASKAICNGHGSQRPRQFAPSHSYGSR